MEINKDNILRTKLQKNGKLLCAKARYSHYGKLYTFLIDKIEETSNWYVEDTYQEVIVKEFVELSIRELPVLLSKIYFSYYFSITTN